MTFVWDVPNGGSAVDNPKPPKGMKRPPPPPNPPGPRDPRGRKFCDDHEDPMVELEGDRKRGKVKKRELLEKDIEDPVCRYAKNRYGMKAEKFTSPSRRSVPDRLFSVATLRPGGFCFFIEFKAPGKDASEKQAKDHKARREMGFKVFVVDNIERGKKIVDAMAAYAAEL